MKKTHINIHHSALDLGENAQFARINNGHKQRFGESVKSKLGYYGGYHYLIERNGVVQQYREDGEVGAHNNVDEMNYKAIGVCFAGNMSVQKPTRDQLNSAYKLIQKLKTKYSILDENIKPHSFYKPTQCPGNYFKDNPWGVICEFQKKTFDWFDQKTRAWADNVLSDLEGFLNESDQFAFRQRLLELLRKLDQGNGLKDKS